MNINTITAEDLRRMPDKEGLILQGCGGDLTEWVDGINEMLTKAGILKDGCQFENVAAFQHGELTCLLYPFDDVKLDIGKLALWRLQTHEVYGGTWLSDFVPNYLGGFIETPEALADKPDCPLIGADGNIFNLLGIASRTLREHGLKEQAKEMSDRVFVSGSYGEALCIIGEYVNMAKQQFANGDIVLSLDPANTNAEDRPAGINALQTKNPLDEVLEETISDMDGVKNIEFIQGCVSNMEFPTPFKDGNSHFFTQIGIPENQYEAFSQGLIEGTADRQKLINGKGVIVDNSAKLLSDYYNYTPQIGDIVKVETADGQWEEFTVMGIGKAPNLGGDSASFYFPQELLPMMKENVSNFNITCIVDVERDQLTEVENKIFQLAENRGGIEVFSISDIITYLQEEMDNIKMPLYGLVFFIAVFGLISLINTLMTNIISRQQEFGILQSVGLSSKQFSKMLQKAKSGSSV